MSLGRSNRVYSVSPSRKARRRCRNIHRSFSINVTNRPNIFNSIIPSTFVPYLLFHYDDVDSHSLSDICAREFGNKTTLPTLLQRQSKNARTCRGCSLAKVFNLDLAKTRTTTDSLTTHITQLLSQLLPTLAKKERKGEPIRGSYLLIVNSLDSSSFFPFSSFKAAVGDSLAVLLISALHLRVKEIPKMPSSPEQITKYEKIESLVKGFKLPSTTYRQVMMLWREEMKNGLKKTSNPTADIKMFPSFVRSLPNGTERGKFLALDLGGTNFRVLLVVLDGPLVDIESKTYLIPQQVMLGTGAQLFDHVAHCVANFIAMHGLERETSLNLGFTFSFPLMQDGLASARLSKWTKGFRCEGVIGKDVCLLLKQALQKCTNVDINVVAVINDAVGTLMSAAHSDRNCEIGLILGTGCNACYMENLDEVETLNLDDDGPNQVIINTEWGAFGDNGCLDFIRTEYDRELDTYSINPGKQLVEKMIGGMYLGEIVRLTLERLTSECLIFQGVDLECDLFNRGKFYTKYLSEIESDRGEFFENTKMILEEIGIDNYTLEDCKIVKYVCALVSARASFLVSAGIASLINCLKRPDITVAVDGSLYRFHPRFHNLMSLKIYELVNPAYKFKLALSHDGSGKGAALVAAVTTHMKVNGRNKKLPPNLQGTPQEVMVES